MTMVGWPEEEAAHSSASSSSTVFVRNLPYEWTDRDLSAAFQDVGPLRRAFVVTTRTRERQSRGFGFVEFALPDDATRAVEERDGRLEKGRRIKVELAVKSGSEKPQRSSSRSSKRPLDRRETAEAADADEMAVEPSISAREEKSEDGTEASEEAEQRHEEQMQAEDDDEEEDEITFQPDAPSPPPRSPRSSSSSSARLPASSSSAVSILVSGIAPSVTSLSSLLSAHSLHPSHVLFPAPESTNTYRAARLTFPSSSLAAAAMAALSSASSSSSSALSPALRCVVLPSSSLRLIIRNLPFHITVRHLLSLLSPFAPSLSAAAFTLPASSASPALNRGFAFVQCGSVEAAEAVMAGVSGKRQWGRLLAVDWSLGKKDYKVREEMAVKMQEMKEKKKESKKRKRHQTADELQDAAVKEEQTASDADSGDEDEAVKVKSEDELTEPRVKEEGDDGDDERSSDDEEATASSLSSPSSASPLPQRRALLSPEDTACTLFIRNLAYDTSEQQLYDRFSSFGKLRYARIVMEKAEGEQQAVSEEKDDAEVRRRSKGVAFVRYARKEDADKVLAMCAASSQQPSAAAASSSRSAKPSLLSSLSETGIVLEGRQLCVVAAVSKSAAASLAAASSSKQKQDKRNLYLAREGVVLSAAEGGEGLSEEELARRERWWREKKKKLENVNYLVSRLRLSVRNLPMEADEKQLKAVFMSAARQAVKEERRSEWERRQAEEAEEAAALARGEEADEERRRRRAESQQAREERRRAPIVLRQVKVVRDKERMTAAGVGRSKRFGFVEFTEHEHALLALRWVNSHAAEAWKAAGGGSGSSRSFVLVEFAVDDVRKVKEREDRQRRWEKMREMKARMLPDKEGRLRRQEAAGGDEVEERKDGNDGAVKIQKEKKKEARERGVCYKCGEGGHQARRCRRKAAAATAEQQQPQQAAAAQAVTAETADDKAAEQPRKRSRAAAEPTVAVKKKAKMSPALAATKSESAAGGGGAEAEADNHQQAQRQPQQTAGKKRRRSAAAEAQLSKRERREQEAESRFDALVDAYKRQWMQAEVAGGAEERKQRTARWFEL